MAIKISEVILKDCARKVYELDNDNNGVLHPFGVKIITEFANGYNLQIPDDFDWRWQAENNGDLQGKLSTRLKTLYRKAEHTRAKRDRFDHLVSIYASNWRKMYLPDASYIIDFNNTLDWDDGDYGDGGSCLWDEFDDARANMRWDGYGAIRWLYMSRWNNKIDTLKGQARAWLAPDTPWDGHFIVFSGYGWGGGYKEALLAELFCRQILGLEYTITYKTLNGGSRFYSGGSGCHLSPIDEADRIPVNSWYCLTTRRFES